jgi:hypothetical protein
MLRSPRSMLCMWLPALVLLSALGAATPIARAQTNAEWRPLKTGLMSRDAYFRVASVFTEPDERSVPITVRFIASNNVVILEQSGVVSDGQPFLAVLTPTSFGDMVRIEVIHEMPGCSQRPYPIAVTIQGYAIESGRGLVGRYLLERSVSASCLP